MTAPTATTGSLGRAMAAWVRSLQRPPRWLRMVAVAFALVLVANVLYHGAQPYAVGLLPNGWDKLAHIALHFVLCSALIVSLGVRRGWWALTLCAAFAGLDEWAQQFNPGRAVSAADWAAGVAGAVLALACAHALTWRSEITGLRRERRRRDEMARWLRPPT